MTIEARSAAGVTAGDLLGAAITRSEDPALLTGEARFGDDIREADLTHLAILRSRHAHARIESIDTAAAEARDGVIGVFTAADLREAGIPGGVPGETADAAVTPTQPLLAEDVVRYDGEPVVAVVATDRYRAHDASAAVDVSYDPRPAAVDPTEAVDEAAPTVHAAAPDNVCYRWTGGDAAATDAAFAEAATVVDLDLVNNRVLPTAIEPRCALARYARSTGDLVVDLSCQKPHATQRQLAASLGLDDHRITVRVPAVGGGFGAKVQPYAGHTLAAFAAMELGRPVKWRATRSEDCRSMVHARHHRSHGELALDGDDRIIGLRARSHAEVGAYAAPGAFGIPTGNFGGNLTGPYDIPAIHVEVTGVFTHTTPLAAYRGAGRPEATYFLERLVDAAARAIDHDPAELRRRNFIPPEAFPYETVSGAVYDSGEYAAALREALDRVGYAAVRDRQAAARAEGRLLGIGLSCFVESGGGGPGSTESGLVRVKPSGKVVVRCGTAENGQGHRTTYAQIAASVLGVDVADVDVVEGDTDTVPEGGGTGGSRSVPSGGSAIHRSAERTRQKARRIAAHRLEASPDDLAFDDGVFAVRGAPQRAVSMAEIAAMAYAPAGLPDDEEPGLESTAYYEPANNTYSFGSHVAVVEVDPETGAVDLDRYVAVDDVGTQINPKLVEGQVHGGVVQGIGQALAEGVVHGENGALLTGSLQDYPVLRAGDAPEIETASTVTPCPHNPLGAKGVGEAGTIAAPPAVVNAVIDALAPVGVDRIDMPVTPERVWRRLRAARSG